MCCTFRQNCMEMLPRVAFSNKSERKRMRVYEADTVQKHRDLIIFSCEILEVGVSGERSALHRYFWQNCFTHFTSDVITLVLGGVGTRDPVHPKEHDVGSNKSQTFETPKSKLMNSCCQTPQLARQTEHFLHLQ